MKSVMSNVDDTFLVFQFHKYKSLSIANTFRTALLIKKHLPTVSVYNIKTK